MHTPRQLLGLLVVLVVSFPSLTISQDRINVFKLASDSPLATDGMAIYGVASDDRTILVGSGADWQVVTRRPGRVTGLAYERGALYFSEEPAKIYRIRLLTSGRLPAGMVIPETSIQLFHQGAVRRPRSLATSGALLIADADAKSVVRIDTETSKVDTVATSLPAPDIDLAADGRMIVTVSETAGEIRQATPRWPGAPLEFIVWNTRQAQAAIEASTAGVVRRRSQLVHKPFAPTIAKGSLYLIDASDGAVYVSYQQQARAIPIAPFTPIKQPTRLLALRESLMVLDGPRGLLDRWPLPTPTQFNLGNDPESALDALYEYLHQRRVLPVRSVTWQTSLEETLRNEGVIRKAVGSGLLTVMCGLNAGACSGLTWTGTGPRVVVPNLPIESALDIDSLRSDELGDRTLGERVDELVVSKVFSEARSNKELWELNASRLEALDTTRSKARQSNEPWGPYLHEDIRQLRRRHFPAGFSLTVPIEKVRAFVAIPRADLDVERLGQIRLRSSGFDWTVLEETAPKAQGTSARTTTSSAAVPCDVATLSKQLEELRKTVKFVLPEGVSLSPVTVGVVDESVVDEQHTAFGPNSAALTFLPPRVAPPAVVRPAHDCDGKDLAKEDHATAVSSLIAGRDKGLEGLVSHVKILSLNGRDDLIGPDLARAFRQRNVRLFNLSIHYNEKLPNNLREKVNDLDALFVVAAGNDITDEKPICESRTPYPAYPVCEGYRKNVLVVAATPLNGLGIIEKVNSAPGSNWNERLVHIAAPGEGFHAASLTGYRPVRGTSFATPVVTAAAAQLFALGVQNPWLIKQRIIATAEYQTNLIGKVFNAGLLNVKRALAHPRHGVLTSKTDTETVAQMEPGEITITWTKGSGGSRTIALKDVRRLTSKGSSGRFRIIYFDEVTDSLIAQDDIEPGEWPVRYQPVDAKGGLEPPVDDHLQNYKDYVGPIIF